MLKSKLAVPIYVSQSIAPDTILIEEATIKRLGIPRAQHISLQFGIYKQTIKVLPEPKRKGLYMHSRLAQLLSIPVTKQLLHLLPSYNQEHKTMKLGPLLAVMLSKETSEDPINPFGALSGYCNELAEASSLSGSIVYFFTPNSLINRNTLINGWIRDGEWRKVYLPLPEVVYNRLPTRQQEETPTVRHFIHEIAKLHGITVFNERFLDKHEVFDLLAQASDVTSFLPHSELLQRIEQLQYMLNTFHVLYLKPIRGSSGRGIYRIISHPDKTYSLEKTSVNSAQARKFVSIKALYKAISPKLKKRKYQLQQGLSVIQVGRKPVDFRALVQKNGLGEWTVTSIVGRIAGDEQFVANLARGGKILPVLETLPSTNLLQHISHDVVYKQLKDAALSIANSLDNQLNESFAEFGIDLAVDVQGKVWLIEVNSKPSKIAKSSLSKKTRPSVRMLLAYTQYLTGFQKGKSAHGNNKTGRNRS